MYNDYNNDPYQANSLTAQDVNRYMAKVYGWMFLGLLITALFSFLTLAALGSRAMSPAFGVVTIVCFVVQMVLVFRLSRGLEKLSAPSAMAMFVVFSALNGVWLSYIFFVYAASTVVIAFVMCAVIFGVMSLYGMATKQDLTSIGKLSMVGLIGIIVVSIVNMFIGSSGLNFLICIIGLVIFLGLTAYDAQKIRGMYAYVAQQGENAVSVSSIQGALRLYLDFINIFLFILRLLGGRR